MPTVSEQLRTARESQGLTVHQLAEITKIKTDHIRALEDGNYAVFAAPVYIRGFVRNCGRILKLDVTELISALDLELGRSPKFNEPLALAGDPPGLLDLLMLQLSKVNWRVAIPVLAFTVLLLAGLVSYRAWQSSHATDPLANLEPALYKSSALQSGDTLSLPVLAPAPKK